MGRAKHFLIADYRAGLKFEEWKDILFIMTFSKSNNSSEKNQKVLEELGFAKEESKESPFGTGTDYFGQEDDCQIF